MPALSNRWSLPGTVLLRRTAGLRCLRRGTALLIAVAILMAVAATAVAPPQRFRWTGLDRLHTAGIAGSRIPARAVVVLWPETSSGSYVESTSVLQRRPAKLVKGSQTADIFLDVVPTEPAELAAARAWLAEGLVPGSPGRQQDMAVRALLDLRLLTHDSGATIAAPTRSWSYVWPRDASWVAAAYAATGHPADAEAVVAFLMRMQDRDGRWEARYLPRADRPVTPDGRPAQLDAVGWVPWAAWFIAQYRPDGDAVLRRFWPMIRAAADAAVRSLRSDGLPAPSPDWWETGPVRSTVGTAAALLAGLRASADVARQLDRPERMRWERAAGRLQRGITRNLAVRGYPRSAAAGSGHDAAVAWLAPPFAPYHSQVARALEITRRALRTPSGALLPGEDFPRDPHVGWTAPTAFFALAAASSGRPGQARQILDWLALHRTRFGALPERVDARGRPASVAPLGWTASAVLLTMVALEQRLPSLPG